MSSPLPHDRASYRWLVIGLLAALGAYGWYAYQQFERLNELHQRRLAQAGIELERTLKTAVDSVNNYRQDLRKDGNKTADGLLRIRRELSAPDAEYALCRFDDDQPYLRFEGNCWGNPGPFERVTLSTPSSILITATPYFAFSTAELACTRDLPCGFRFDTATFFRELAFPDSFELILVTDSGGKVLFEDAPSRRRWRQWLRRSERTYLDSGADVAPAIQILDLSSALGASPGWTKLSAASVRTTLELAGVSYQVYLQPVSTGGAPLIAGAAVPTSVLIRDALVVDFSFVAVLVFLVLLSVFGFPFVKLAAIDRRERFRLRDVTLLYLSTALVLTLLTLAVLALDGYLRWNAEADRGLNQLAHRLEGNFTDEVQSIQDQLRQYDGQLRSLLEDTRRKPCAVQTRWWSADARGEQVPRLVRQDLMMEVVAWIGSDGEQLWKVTAMKAGNQVKVGQRAYFVAVRDGDYNLYGGGGPSFIGPDRAITDGKFYMFLSVPSSIPNGTWATASCIAPRDGAPEGKSESADTRQEAYTAMTSTHLLSLRRPPLPAGYGFALVNREGRVLLHFDPRFALRENLFEELGDGDSARALVYSGADGYLATRYRERPHHLYFKRIRISQEGDDAVAGLYMVAFRDTSVARSVVARVFVAGLAGPIVLPMLLIGITMGLMGLVSARSSRRWSEWLWPHDGLQSMYRRLTCWLSGLLALSFGLYGMGFGDVVVFLMPLVAAATAVLVYVGYAAPKRRRPLTWPWWHTATLVLVLACVVVVPTTIFFRVALAHEFGKLVDTEQHWVKTQERDGAVDLAAEVRDKNGSAAFREALTRRLPTFEISPAPFDTQLIDRPSTDRAVTLLFRSLDRMLPIASEGDARLRLNAQRSGFSPPGTVLEWWRITPLAVLCFTLMLTLLVAWIHWSRARIFHAAVATWADRGGTARSAESPEGAGCEQAWAECAEDERYVLIQVTREGIANPKQHELVDSLVARGLLHLDPDLQPYSKTFQEFVRNQEALLKEQLTAWEHVHATHSWRYTSNVFVVLVGALATFLIATQPGLQTSVVSILTGLTTVLGAGSKLRDVVRPWFLRRQADT